MTDGLSLPFNNPVICTHFGGQGGQFKLLNYASVILKSGSY